MKNIVQLLALRIKKGEMTLEQVPEIYRIEVEEVINKG